MLRIYNAITGYRYPVSNGEENMCKCLFVQSNIINNNINNNNNNNNVKYNARRNAI